MRSLDVLNFMNGATFDQFKDFMLNTISPAIVLKKLIQPLAAGIRTSLVCPGLAQLADFVQTLGFGGSGAAPRGAEGEGLGDFGVDAVGLCFKMF